MQNMYVNVIKLSAATNTVSFNIFYVKCRPMPLIVAFLSQSVVLQDFPWGKRSSVLGPISQMAPGY